MAVEFKFTGDSNQLAREYDKLVRKADRLEKKNVQLSSRSKAAAAELRKQAESQTATFDGAASSIAKSVAGYVTLQGAISTTIGLLKEQREVERQAARDGREAEFDVAKLAQLAPDQESLDQLVGKQREFHYAGGGSSLGESARAVFAMESAGLLGEFDVFKDLASSGIERDVATLAKAVATLQTGLGNEETGDARPIVSKALEASAYAPGNIAQLLEATSRSAGSASALDLSDEEVMAATALVGKSTGSLDQGGTQVSALLSVLEKKSFEGQPLLDSIREIEDKRMSGDELFKYFGREEAVKGFRTIAANPEQFQTILGAVDEANTRDVVKQRVALTESRPELVAAKMSRIEKARSQLDLIDEGAITSLADSVNERVNRRGREGLQEVYGDHGLTDAMIGAGNFVTNTMRFFQGDDSFIRDNANRNTPELTQLEKLRPSEVATTGIGTAEGSAVEGVKVLVEIRDELKGQRSSNAHAARSEARLPPE